MHPKPRRLAIGDYVRQLIRLLRCGDAAGRVPREHLSGRRHIHSARNRSAGGFSLGRGDRIVRKCPGPEVEHDGVSFVGRDVNEVFAVGNAGAAVFVPVRRNNSTEARAQSAVEAIVCGEGKGVDAAVGRSGPQCRGQLEQKHCLARCTQDGESESNVVLRRELYIENGCYCGQLQPKTDHFSVCDRARQSSAELLLSLIL